MPFSTLAQALLVLATPLLMGLGSPQTCAELLDKATSELAEEQYPSMLSIAQERQLQCPGPDSSFLAGLARANMLDKLLVPEAERAFVREEALQALRDAVPEIRPEWQRTALSWISYLDELPEDTAVPPGKPSTGRASPQSEAAWAPHRAAPPFEPDLFPWGPVLLGSAGALTLASGFVTYLVAAHSASELKRAEQACSGRCSYTPPSRLQLLRDHDTTATLLTVSDVLLLAGSASVVGALAWWALRHTPSDPPPELAIAPWLGRGTAGAHLRVSF